MAKNATTNLTAPDAESASNQVRDITMSVPFETQPRTLCIHEGQGNYILFNLNNALQHARTHHRNAQISFVCSLCRKEYRSKHAALFHVPKCPGPAEPSTSDFQCAHYYLSFQSQRGLSHHERKAHPLVRNTKRQQAAQPAPPRPNAKGFGKIWSKEELDLMLELERRFKGHSRIAKDMSSYLPGKTLKQIRDKRREPSYKTLLQATLGDKDGTNSSYGDEPTAAEYVPTLPRANLPQNSPHVRTIDDDPTCHPGPHGHPEKWDRPTGSTPDAQHRSGLGGSITRPNIGHGRN